MRSRTSLTALLATVGFALCVAVPDAATAATALGCQTGKLRAVGAEMAAQIACEQRGLGGDATAACIALAVRRREAAFSRYERTGACSTTGDSAILGDAVENAVSALRGLLLPGGPAPSACTVRQLAAARVAIARLVRAHLRHARTPDPVRLAAAVADARTELGKRFVRAAQRGDCLSASTGDGVSTSLEAAAVTFRGMLLGTCPCWTTAQLDAAFPPGFFDAAGRGGAVCDGIEPSMSAADTCDLQGPSGQVLALPRGGAAVLDGSACVLTPDLDPNDDGTCSGVPTLVGISGEFVAACTAQLLLSEPYRQLCN